MPNSVGELVRQQESDYTRGTTQISKYVSFNMHNTLEKIDAYLNSKHVSGPNDSLGRPKPFFNIVTAVVNVWFRATDIDRKDIKIRATKAKDWIDSFLATIHLREWMRKEDFGSFLNDWGRSLARYGSSVVKFVENDGGLHVYVVPWNMIICDAVDFEVNPQIEVLELTLGQLERRITTHGYDAGQVKALKEALTSRETLDSKKKDNKADYIKLYEVHGLLPKSYISGDEADKDKYVQQMHVISFVGKKTGRSTTDYQDFTLYKGTEYKSPYELTHLIREDGRTLSIGAVEHMFQPQQWVNDSIKKTKDTLDIVSKVIFQTADANMVGRNVLTNMETGQVIVNTTNMPLTKLDNSKTDLVGMQNFAVQWKQLGNEIVGVSEAMLGAMPKSGTAWRQTEALLNENYSLFALMTQNKGLQLEGMLRRRILPYIKRKHLDNAKEIATTLTQHEIDRIDPLYIKNTAIRKSNEQVLERLTNLEPTMPDMQLGTMASEMQGMQETMQNLGNQRFFKPSDISDKMWKAQFKNLEWEVEIDITGENSDTQNALTTINTALKLVLTPGFDQNPKAKALLGRALELTGAMSPIEYNAIPNMPVLATTPQPGNPTQVPALGSLESNQQ